MALVYFTGFDEMATGSADAARFFQFSQASNGLSSMTILSSGGAFGGKRLRFGGNAGRVTRIGAAEGRADFVAGWLTGPRMMFGAITAIVGSSSRYRGGGVLPGGSCFIYDDSASPVVQKSYPAWGTPAWVEMGYAGGAFQIYVNGLLRLAYVIAEVNLNLISPGGNSAPDDVYYDDVIFWNSDDSGDGFNTFPIGPQRIESLGNRAPGSSAQWTPDTGSNWEAVNAGGWAGGVGVEATPVGLVDKHLIETPSWRSAQLRGYQQRISGLSLDAELGHARLTGSFGSESYTTEPYPLPYSSSEVIFGPFIPGPLSQDDFDTAEFGYISA